MARTVEGVLVTYVRSALRTGESRKAHADTLEVFHLGEEPTRAEVNARLSALQAGNAPFFRTLLEVSVDLSSTKRIAHREPQYPQAQHMSQLWLFTT